MKCRYNLRACYSAYAQREPPLHNFKQMSNMLRSAFSRLPSVPVERGLEIRGPMQVGGRSSRERGMGCLEKVSEGTDWGIGDYPDDTWCRERKCSIQMTSRAQCRDGWGQTSADPRRNAPNGPWWTWHVVQVMFKPWLWAWFCPIITYDLICSLWPSPIYYALALHALYLETGPGKDDYV